MTSSPQLLYLPDTLKNWPWPRVINPHYKEMAAESNAWAKSFKLFNPKSQYAYEKCDFGKQHVSQLAPVPAHLIADSTLRFPTLALGQ